MNNLFSVPFMKSNEILGIGNENDDFFSQPMKNDLTDFEHQSNEGISIKGTNFASFADNSEKNNIHTNNTHNTTNYYINLPTPINYTEELSKIGQKTKRQNLTKEEIELKKEKKLLMNRISAKKSRQKKKDYITFLEKEIQDLKAQIEKKSTKKTKKLKPNNNNNISGKSDEFNLVRNLYIIRIVG